MKARLHFSLFIRKIELFLFIEPKCLVTISKLAFDSRFTMPNFPLVCLFANIRFSELYVFCILIISCLIKHLPLCSSSFKFITQQYEILMQLNISIIVVIVWALCIFIYLLFKAAPAAYGCFQARGQNRDVAARLPHSHVNLGSKARLWPTPQMEATIWANTKHMGFLNPLDP